MKTTSYCKEVQQGRPYMIIVHTRGGNYRKTYATAQGLPDKVAALDRLLAEKQITSYNVITRPFCIEK